MQNNDAELIQQTLEGDQRAFSALVRKYQKPLHALVWRKIGDFHIAEEITQDIFLNVYKKLQTLKNPNLFAGWLYVSATRRCHAWLKKKRIPMESLEITSPEELEALAYTQYRAEQQEESVNEQQREVVKRLLQKLPESERTVVTLHYLGDMTCEDISQFLGVSPNTVKSRLHRARKRLKKAEHIVRENLGGFQFTTTLTETVLQEIARIKPTPPASGKPWMPWAVAASTAALVVLLMGSGTQYLPRFQQPYSFDATAEMTVELVDASIISVSKQRVTPRNQIGNADTPGNRNGNVNRGANALQVPADHSKPLEKPTIIKSPWLPMGGPEGTSGGRAGLFATSNRTLYAVAARGIYRLTENEKAWTLICESTPTRQFQTPMTERGNILYILTPNDLLASTDAGKTWDTVGPRPEGRALELLVTEEAFYLVFEKHIFRSDDVGFYHLSDDSSMLMAVQGVPAFAEDTLQVEWMKKIRNAPAGRRRSELGYQKRTDMSNIIEEQITNGGFTMTGETVYMEFRHKLFRWRKGETQWFNTGIVDTTERAPGADTSKGLTLAASQNVVYAGKRDGSLFQSLDSGENWKEITADLAFSFAYVEEIVFAGATVYVVTDQGVMNSHDGINWNVLTNTDRHQVPITRIAVDGDKVYGVGNQGVYRIDTQTGTCIQMSSEVPYKITAFAVDRGIFYIGTRHRGVLRLQLNQSYN